MTTTLTPIEELASDQFAVHEEAGVGALARQLADLRQLRQTLSALEHELEAALAKQLGGGDHPVEGVGTLTVRRGAARKRWDSPRLVAVVAARAADEYGLGPDGEPLPPAVLAERVAIELAKCCGADRPSSPWRVTELDKRGIEAKRFFESEGGRMSVQIQ
ncbi:MAG: hypothetical protein M3404_01850 [Actinomycetota bacterium]|nr:hypothetical protein [Actinomycetota bacterium]